MTAKSVLLRSHGLRPRARAPTCPPLLRHWWALCWENAIYSKEQMTNNQIWLSTKFSHLGYQIFSWRWPMFSIAECKIINSGNDNYGILKISKNKFDSDL